MATPHPNEILVSLNRAAKAQRQLEALPGAVPALTGAFVVLSAFAGEQQRASEARKGLVQRFTPRTEPPPS